MGTVRGAVCRMCWCGITLALVLLHGARPAPAYEHHNSPVHYAEYSEATFTAARMARKPVFLLLSARWCYWCKVYQERALNTADVSAFLNEHFMPVFVDIDQRPDLEHLYGVKVLPTSVVFTSTGEPFLTFSGTLAPQPFLDGMRETLKRMAQDHRVPRLEDAPTSDDVRGYLDDPVPPGALAARIADLEARFDTLLRDAFDPQQGGFGNGKRFPMPWLLAWLIPQEDAAHERMLRNTLTSIRAHLYDAVEGGFFRYAERSNWTRPRYEKMLTVNTGLLRIFNQLAGSGDPDAVEVRRRTLRFLNERLTDESTGGFLASLDGKSPRYYRLDAQARQSFATPPQADPAIYTEAHARALVDLHAVAQANGDAALAAKVRRGRRLLMRELIHPQLGPLDRRGGKPSGLLKDTAWAALACADALRSPDAEEARIGKACLDALLGHADARLFDPTAGLYRMWNLQASAQVRPGETVSDELPMAANAVLLLALVRAAADHSDDPYSRRAQQLGGTLSGIDLTVFEDDPEDSGKVFLEDTALLLTALRSLVDAAPQFHSRRF